VNVFIDIFDALMTRTPVCKIKVRVEPVIEVDQQDTIDRPYAGNQFYREAKKM